MKQPSLRIIVLEYYGYSCWYCGIALTLDNATKDHIVPRVHGGTNDLSNLVPSCEQCNTKKGNKSYESFRDVAFSETYRGRAIMAARNTAAPFLRAAATKLGSPMLFPGELTGKQAK